MNEKFIWIGFTISIVAGLQGFFWLICKYISPFGFWKSCGILWVIILYLWLNLMRIKRREETYYKYIDEMYDEFDRGININHNE